jgi:hypothetical protein
MASSKVPDQGTTQVVGDSDELRPVSDEAPEYPRFQKPGQRFDYKVTDVGQGTNFDGDPCLQHEGELLAEATNVDKDGKDVILAPGTEIRINAGQPILERKLRRAERQFNGLVGRRVVIVYKGLIKTSNGKSAKDFDVLVGGRVTYTDPGVD